MGVNLKRRLRLAIIICNSCKRVLPQTEFSRRGQSYRHTCKRCRPILRTPARKAYEKLYRHTHKEHISNYRRERNCRLKLEAMSYYCAGGKPSCACCGVDNLEFLCFDHIEGGGTKHRKSINNRGRQFYIWLRLNDFPTGYRVLCHNCNASLAYYGHCPHNEQDKS